MGNDFSSAAVENDNFDSMKKYAGFSPKQVEMIKERFELMCDENSTVDKGIFAKLLKISAMEAETVFKLFDMDGSGSVDSYEFVCGLALLSQSTLDEKAELIFDLYDFDKSQLITLDELQVLMKTTLTSLAAMNNTKPPTLKQIEAKSKEIIKGWDTNKDGSMSREEFKSFVSKDPDVLRLLMNYGLVNKEELRQDFGGKGEDVPDCDSDLEEELRHADIDPRSEKRTLGIEYSAKDKNPDDMYDVEDIDEGDQFMAVKPWIGTVKNSVPTGYAPKKGESDAPEASLDLEYVHGYRCHDARNNLKYAPNGQAVYHTAAVGVVLDTKSNTQKFCIEHTDDITCLDICNELVVTGQVGAKPAVVVWDCNTRETKAIFQGDLQKSIAQVCFSSDKKFVAAIANDDDHTIGIFNVEKFMDPKYDKRKAKTDGTIIFGKGPKAGVLDAKFDPTNKTLILACVKEVNFVSFESNVIKCTKATGWGKNPLQAVLCIGFIDQNILTGTFNGSIFVWKGKNLSNTIPDAHKGGVNAIWSRKTTKGVITGGNDGTIIIWDQNLKKSNTIDIKTADIRSMNPKVRSICESGNKILVGTRGGEIIEFTDLKPKVVMRGHFDDELWGLVVHPKPARKEYVTVGEDQLLGLWDITTRKQKLGVKIDYPAKVLAYSPDEKFLAVGCKNGFVLIMDPEKLSVNNTIKDRTKEISVLKFSPDSELLAVGAHDSEIFVYNAKKGFKIQSKMRGHHSTITHFDFAIGSNVLQSTCTSYELLYFDTKSGKRNPSGASGNRDEPWATWTCVLGWPVQGIWPECSDGSDINSLDRHPHGNVLATGDDFSKVKLFKYPCAIERASFVKVVGHSSHVTCVRFTSAGDYLISTGGHDKSIFQWKYHFDENGDQQIGEINQSMAEEEEEGEEKKEEDEMFQEEVIEGGDEALAVKPFKGQVDKSWPTGFTVAKDAAKAPNGNLSLKYCHGFRCFDAKNAAKYCANPEKVVFVGAALGVVMDIKTKEQSFFQMHEEDVICLAISPNGKFAASGQMAQKGKAKRIDMFVWEIETKQMVSRMNNFHLRAVCLVAFSPDGSKLLSIGRDDDNSLAIYDWSQGLLLTTAKVDQSKVTGLAYKSESEFMTCGLKHVKFYTLTGKNVKALRGSLQTDQQSESFLCATYAFGNTAVCGTQTGNLVPFNGTASGKSVKAHTGGVWTLVAQKTNLFSGGADGRILIWAGGLTKSVEISNMAKISKFLPGIVSLDVRPDGNTFLVGTRGSEIYEVKKDGSKADLLLQGHYDGELWGCAVSPDSMKYVTCGGDNTIRLWDAKKLWMLAATKPLENDVRSVYWAPNGKFIVAGDMKGKIILLDPKDLTIKDQLQSSFTKQNQWIEDIKISPDSTRLAFGAHGGTSPIEIMAITNDSKLSKKPSINVGLSSALLHVDWSTDNNFLVVNSQAYELKFINVSAGKDVSASSSKDVDWFTWTCKLGFPVIGIFQSVDYTDVNTVCRAGNRKILATGDDNGKVNLFKYPCVVEKAQCKGYIGHSSHVTRVKFTYDDSRVISTGGNDKCVLVWDTDFGGGEGAKAIKREEEEEEVHQEVDQQEIDREEAQYVNKKTKKDKYERTKKDIPDESEGVEAAGGDFFQVEKIEGGDEFLAVKPWLGAIKEPTGWKKAPLNQNQAPKVDLELEYVHGYRAKDCRNNLRYLKEGNIVYHAAALGIVMDIASNTQRYFKEHTDDITAMDVHPNGIFVATGQLGPKPEIYIWDSNSLQIIWKYKVGLEKGIAALTFSPSGNKLAGTAIDDNHYVAVYDTELGTLVCSEKGDTAKIVDLKFKSENEFASVGPKHFKLWNFQNKQITSKKGSFGTACDLLRCVTFSEPNFLVGDAKGNMQVWNGNSMSKSHKLHEGGVDSIWAGPNNIITGGADQVIQILDKKTYAALAKIQFNTLVKTSICAQIRSACFSADGKTMLVGTYGSEIYEISTNDPKISNASKFGNPKEIMKGHYTPNQKWTNEIWGLGIFSDGDRWCTCSDDATLRIWSMSKRKQIKAIKLDTDKDGKTLPPDPTTKDLDESAKGRSIDVSPDGKYIAVGCKDGTLRVFEVDENSNMKQIHVSKLAKEWIQELKFSPDGHTLAVGSHDNGIYLRNVPDFSKKGPVMKKHSSFITHLDWSVDGNNLHSNCGAYELLFWDANTGKQITGGATAFRDERWATWTCVLGWPVQGIWPPFTSGDDINYVSRSASKTPGGYELLAMADDFGKVKLLRYPSIQKGSEGVVGVGHSSHVTCVKFGPKDDWLFSTGGEDNCVFQWKVTSQVK